MNLLMVVNKVEKDWTSYVSYTIIWCINHKFWIRLNTDGASRRDISACSGGIFQNAEGKWISGFPVPWVDVMRI